MCPQGVEYWGNAGKPRQNNVTIDDSLLPINRRCKAQCVNQMSDFQRDLVRADVSEGYKLETQPLSKKEEA